MNLIFISVLFILFEFNCPSKCLKITELNPPQYIVFQNNSEITFKSSNKTAEKVKKTYLIKGKFDKVPHPVTLSDEFVRANATDILQYSQFSNKTHFSKGFIHTVVECYKNHHNLVLRPDDIWTAIMVQFSFYVNANAESLRKKFVNFEGKKELVVRLDHGLYDSSYDIFANEMVKEIHKNLVNDQVAGWTLPNFSTTTLDDIITNSVILMSTLQKYFDYGAEIGCGIPEITLLGTLEDWKNIAERIEKFKDYGLEKWTNLLRPVMSKFIEAKSGKIDRDFWEDICRIEPDGYFGEYLNGWITVFNIFTNEGVWRGYVGNGNQWPVIELDDFTSGIVTVPVKIDNNGVEVRSTMFAGHMGQEVLKNEVTMQPHSGWAIALSN